MKKSKKKNMKKYVLINGAVFLIGLVIIIIIRNDTSVLGAFIKLIGLSFTLMSAFLLILSFFHITSKKLD